MLRTLHLICALQLATPALSRALSPPDEQIIPTPTLSRRAPSPSQELPKIPTVSPQLRQMMEDCGLGEVLKAHACPTGKTEYMKIAMKQGVKWNHIVIWHAVLAIFQKCAIFAQF